MIDLRKYGMDPEATFSCGQCFRWQPAADGGYVGVVGKRVGRIRNGILCCPLEDLPFWQRYFSLELDYAALRRDLIKRDPKLAVCAEYGGGIRLLHQELWETTASFIISANNNIPRIRRIIDTLCTLYGDAIEDAGERFYTFPSPKRLAGLPREALAPLKAGYRDLYLLDAARQFADGRIAEQSISKLSTQEAGEKLMSIRGVGRKVADCILLFGLGRYEVFPRDVWINRVMREIYGLSEKDCETFAAETYGPLAGLAQQYLFYYYRDHLKVGMSL